MALEHSLHPSSSTDGEPISVAQGGGNILIHTVPKGWTDRVILHIANLAGATSTTMTILVNSVTALSIGMPPGSVYDYEVGVSGGAAGKTIHVSASGGDTAVKVTGAIHRGGLARKYN